ncbi:serine/threonine protein kinase, partial [Myxococcota bacterium]|nr:serine/threonine protein kinase [Myxococcota bacterium]
MAFPQKFGKYTLLKRLATGGMAEIFLARQTGLDGFEKDVVLKRLLPSHQGEEDLVTMFLDEARIAANLIHPNIAQIYDLGREEGDHFIVMEHVRGVNLSHLCLRSIDAGSFLPLNHAVRIIIEVCDALAYAHSQTHEDGRPREIVHRDVSPTNILVTYDGSVKLVDFGIAKATHKAGITRVGQIKGKFGYMSPEQTQGVEVDHRTDIFALGINLYEITLGRRLFQGENEVEMLDAIEACRVTPPRELEPQYPASLERVVLRALARAPDARYQSIRDMQIDLEAFMAEAGLRSASGMLSVYMNNLFHAQIEAERAEEKALIEMARAGQTYAGQTYAGQTYTAQAEAPEPLAGEVSEVIELDESALREVPMAPTPLAQAVMRA